MITVTYTPNQQPTSGTPVDSQFMIPDTYTYNLGLIHDDPEDLNYDVSFTINGTDIASHTDFISWDNVNHVLHFFPTDNIQGGIHDMIMIVDDAISTPLSVPFTVDVVFNFPLIALRPLADVQLIVGNYFEIEYDPDDYFEDPEGFAFTTDWKLEGLDFGPYWATWWTHNNTINGYTTIVNIGDFLLDFIGVDTAFQETKI